MMSKVYTTEGMVEEASFSKTTMITDIRNIASENPTREMWKYLRYILDINRTTDVLSQIHNVPSKQKDNVKKQATQIAYCIRQAEEYFKASSQVGLSTRPLLLYYGAVSLSQALVLVWKDGTYSLDARRKQEHHKHHGLEPVGESNAVIAHRVIESCVILCAPES